MKTTLLTILMLIFSSVLFAQTAANIIQNYDLSNGDTTFQQKYLHNAAWSLQFNMTDPRGTRDGYVIIQESSDGSYWTDYASNSYFLLDSASVTIGATTFWNVEISGTDTVYTYRYSDDYFDANYMRVKIDVNNITGGTLNGIINFKTSK